MLLAACSGDSRTSSNTAATVISASKPVLHLLRLADGSELVVDSGSVVRVSPNFNLRDRAVYIDGEALVKPALKSNLPFIVHTRALHITVLRDSLPAAFLVSAFSHNNGEEVDVRQGRLLVQKSYPSKTDSAAETVGPREMIMINTEIDLMEKETADSATLKKMERFRD